MTDLSSENCPPVFTRFLQVWASTVPLIQALPPEHQHDLARTICNLPPLNDPVEPSLAGVATELRAVAIEISQRRSFQDRYAGDLQAAIDAGQPSTSGRKVRASFVPPPEYDASPAPSPTPSPRSDHAALPPTSQTGSVSAPGLLSPFTLEQASPTRPTAQARSRTPSPASTSSARRRTPSPTILTEDAPAIDFIRETLYASLYDVLSTHTSLRALLRSDPARAYFASVSLAILYVARTSMTPQGSVIGVLGQELTVADCPNELKAFMTELAALGKLAGEMQEEDTEEAMRLAQRGEGVPVPRMERVEEALEKGVSLGGESGSARRLVRNLADRQEARRSVQGRALGFANRVNALSLRLTQLKAFKERQSEVFKVLAGVGRY
jgi:hypothetical protein